MTTRIPPELIFHIVGFLQDSKPDLVACSLCCSALATVTRPLLFHTLRTNLDSGAAERFECLLESGPEVLTLIKRIDVDISDFEPDVNYRTIAAVSQTMASHPIQRTPPTLGIAIQAGGRSSRWFSRQLLSCLNPVIHRVTSLYLAFDFIAAVQFWDFVLEFPRLKSLTLGHIRLITGVRAPFHRESEISHITLKETALSSDARWFLSDHLLPLPSLTSLDVRFPTNFRTPRRLAEPHASTVRTLRFGMPIIPSPATSWNKLGDPRKFWVINPVCYVTLTPPVKAIAEFISQFTNLETLTFQGLFAPRLRVQQSPFTLEWIPVALSAVSSALRKLTMEVVAGHLSYLDIIPWSAVDERLAHQLQSVTVVEVLVATPAGVNYLLDNVPQEMEKRLPLAARRGVLRCSAVSEHPHDNIWCVFPRFFAPADILSHSNYL